MKAAPVPEIPYGSAPGFAIEERFVLPIDARMVAEYYGVSADDLRSGNEHPSRLLMHARHALMWKLNHLRKQPATMVARFLQCSPRSVTDGARAHANRIDEARQRAQQEGANEDAGEGEA